MIGLVAACLFVATPQLAATGNDSGLWFIGDTDPTVVNFDPKTKGLDYALCSRSSTDSYQLLQRLNHRPEHIVLFQNSIFCVDYNLNISLYSIPQSVSAHRDVTAKMSLQSILHLQKSPTDVLSSEHSIIVCCGGSSLLLNAFDGTNWKELPTLKKPNARVTILSGTTIAAVPSEDGVTLWTLSDGTWVVGETVSLLGTFETILAKDDWPILVSIKNGLAHIVGIQQGKRIEIATCEVPKGRWSLVPSPLGLSMLGVERNGTTTVLDISWPSGNNIDLTVMHQAEIERASFFESYSFLLLMVVFSIFILLKIRKRSPNTPN
jgi:hypothetical protein